MPDEHMWLLALAGAAQATLRVCISKEGKVAHRAQVQPPRPIRSTAGPPGSTEQSRQSHPASHWKEDEQ